MRHAAEICHFVELRSNANISLQVGHITSENHAVWRMSEAAILPFSKSSMHLTEDERTLNQKQLNLIEYLLKEKYFYFSYTYDLTSSQQRLNSVFCQQQQINGASKSLPISSHNPTFAWNFNILRPFCAKVDFLSFCVAVIHGAIFINNCSINGKYFRWSLISRRSNKRAGTRFFRRGCDSTGNVANFVETEQIVEYGDVISSFVQTRGSMPMFWSQIPNLMYMPKPTLDMVDSTSAFVSHIRDQVQTYGGQTLVNLINHQKDEGLLQTKLQSLCQTVNVPGVCYEAFDFHKECSKLRWDRLYILIDKLRNNLNTYGCFVKRKNESPKKPGHVLQNGVFRTNCMDCLDRTNVVQSLLAKENLDFVLRDFGILLNGMTTSTHREFMQLFRHTWADHANLLALQYAGSGALKTDFTRTGKRTIRGALEDAQHALTRYWKNNFFDGQRQDAIDLFLGTATATDVRVMIDEPAKKWIYLPLFLIGDVSMLFLTILLSSEFETSHHLFLIFLIAIAILLASLIMRKAHVFVDHPKFTSTSKLSIY